MSTHLPTDAAARNEYPLADGLLYYFPNALAKVAQLSKIANEQHNPGEPMHWARNKSTDHANKILRHQLDAGTVDSDGTLHSTKVAWRALAQLEDELIAAGAKPGRNARGAPAPKEHRRVATPAEMMALLFVSEDLPPNLAAACQTRENPLKHVELQAQDDPRAGMVDVAVTAPKFPPYSERNEPKKGHLVRVVEVTWRDEAEGVRLGMTGVVQDNGFAPYVRLHDLRRSHCFSRYQLERIA